MESSDGAGSSEGVESSEGSESSHGAKSPEGTGSPHEPEPAGWVEPDSLLPLRWGSYTERLLIGGAMLVSGALLIVQTTAYTAYLGWLGAVMHVAGWAILPTSGPRRAIAAPLSVLTFVTMLIGPALAWLTALPLGLWLLVRRRPGITYLLVPLPAIIAFGTQVIGGADARLLVFLAAFAAAAACAWTARAIAVRELGPR